MKTKRLIAIGLIFLGVIGLAIAFAPLLGLMSITPAAFDDYSTEFDPTNSSIECNGTSPELELITKQVDFTQQLISLNSTKGTPKTFCGTTADNIEYNQYNDSVLLKKWGDFDIYDQAIEGVGVAPSNKCTTTTTAPFRYSLGVEAYSAGGAFDIGWIPPQKMTIVGFGVDTRVMCDDSFIAVSDSWNLQSEGDPNSSFQKTENYRECTFGKGLNQVCVFDKPLEVTPLKKYAFRARGASKTRVFMKQEIKPFEMTLSYTVPRSTIPNELHYREYSCPLESGRYLTAQTFIEHENISANTFAYEPNYFCSRHGIIQTQLATQRSIETTEEYKQIVSGQTVTVPAGDTWTFFYVPKINVNLPIKCEEGDYYDVETEKCVQLVSGFVYICTDPTTNLVGNQCVKEADLTIICPNNQDPIDGKCYIYGTPTIICPTGYTQSGNECHRQGTTITDCPEGYDLRDGACYIEGKNIIECPDGYDLLNSKCYEIMELITDCPDGYDLIGGACWTTGNLNMVCPDGTHKAIIEEKERCIIDSTFCPSGYSRQDDKCVKEGEIICPSGTIKIGDNCQRTETVCPEGSIEINNACVREGEIVCPEGTTMNEAKQCVQEPLELPDINYLSAGIGTISMILGAIILRF